VVGRINKLLGRRWSMFVDIIGTFALVGMPAVLPEGPSSAWPIAAAAFLAGAGGTMWTVNSRVITQTFVPNEMLGRFSAASRMVAWGMTPIAAAVVGVLAQVFSYRVAFGTFAVLCLVLVYPFLRVVTADAVAAVDRIAAEDDGDKDDDDKGSGAKEAGTTDADADATVATGAPVGTGATVGAAVAEAAPRTADAGSEGDRR
jgi:MFS family permease